MNGALSVILGLMYFWLARMTLVGSATARMIIIMLAAINLFFAFFRLPFGWGIILVSLLIIAMVQHPVGEGVLHPDRLTRRPRGGRSAAQAQSWPSSASSALSSVPS